MSGADVKPPARVTVVDRVYAAFLGIIVQKRFDAADDLAGIMH
jgi:hypothetical protein